MNFNFLNIFSNKEKKDIKTKNLYSNKQGTFAVLEIENQLLAILPEYKGHFLIDNDMRDDISAIAFVEFYEEKEHNSKSLTFKFFIGTNKGSLKFCKIKILDKNNKNLDKNVQNDLKNIYNFKINESQRSIVNGIVLHQIGDNNHIIISVDKKLIHI